MKLLLISNSTNAGEEYLRYPLPEIGRFLDGVREIVFVPYAAVTFSYADYEKKVQARFAELGIRVRSVHRAKDPAALVRGAEAICVGGGNTFALAKKMQQQGVLLAIASKNNSEDVQSACRENPHMIRKEADFSAIYADWNPKPVNIKKIAEELNLGLDSFVFVDDNEAEREAMRIQQPEVTVVDGRSL